MTIVENENGRLGVAKSVIRPANFCIPSAGGGGYQPVTHGARRKFKYREPLFLCGHGVRIRMDHNTLLIRNGFTHYPQKTEEIRFFPGDANLPDRIVILDGSGGISLDALNWMNDQKINLIQLNWRGEVSAIGGGASYGANPKLAEAQLKAKNGTRNLEIARWLIGEKIAASISTLQEVIPNSEIRENGIARLERRRAELKSTKKSFSVSQLLGIEGDCAAAYFRTWLGLPINWSGTSRKPIPNNWREVNRQALLSLPLDAYKKYEVQVERGFIQAAKFLHLLHIYRIFDLPYQSQIVPLAAILADIGQSWEHDANRAMLVRWYWNGVFGDPDAVEAELTMAMA